MKLVIVESPAKCSKIAGFLGAGYKVIASMGHIRTLEEQLEAVGIDRDFEPRMRFMTKEKGKAIAAIKEAAAQAEEVILAADDDREGEAIAYSIAVLLRLDPRTTKRAVFHEITRPAVTAAVANPRLLDMNKVNAQMARAQLDMMVGFTISPLLWKHVERGLSAGRCQTPALRFVCDREDQIAAHTTSSSWGLEGSWITGTKATIQAHMIDELEDEESATNYLEQVADTATVTDVTIRPWSEGAPLPLITSSLQQVASSLYRSAPKNTMRIAQRLYEAGHITYMRTDKAVLGEEAQAEARALVISQFGPDYVASPAATPKSKSSQQQAQEAHEAIRPTHFDVATLVGQEWTPLDIKIYQLIRIRALQSVMSPVRGQAVQVRFQTADDEAADFLWSANARITTFQGWRLPSATSVADDDEEEEAGSDQATWNTLTSLSEGSELRWTEMRAVPKLTKAPPRYTEATLVAALERRGIGRPSTFAALLAAIEEKGYVEKKNIEGTKVSLHTLSRRPGQWPPTRTPVQRSIGGERDRLVPTELGRRALKFAVEHFDDLFGYEFTAAMESRLDAVAEGRETCKAVLQDTWTSYKERYETLSAAPTATRQQRDFGGGLKAIMTRKGPMLLREQDKAKAEFFPWPEGATIETITEEMARAAAVVNSLGTYDGQPMIRRDGKFGPYVVAGTLNVPWTATDTEETLRAKFAAKAATAGTTVGPYTFKVGQYGPYMYKTALQTKKFVNVPAAINPSKLTVREADELYKAGLAAAANKRTYKRT